MDSSARNLEIVVLYHADCADGFGAAWSAWKKFGVEATYIAMHHGDPVPNDAIGSKVYMLDYCFKGAFFDEVVRNSSELFLIDHHQSAEFAKSLPGSFDITHSGAVLSWNYFHPGEATPQLLLHIEDIDLWNFKLEKTTEITQAVSSYKHEFGKFSELVLLCESKEGRQRLIQDGEALMRKMNLVIEKVVANAETIKFEGMNVPIVNTTNFGSHIAQALIKKGPPIAMYWSRIGKKIVVSLRSDGTVDVAKLAEKYGGGGHPRASGFSWEEDNFLSIPDRIKK
ncbi:MAG: DHHA1 domain-containing protein [Patescibacteria group bacterium]